MSLANIRAQIRQQLYADENQCVAFLLKENHLDNLSREKILVDAKLLVERSRQNSHARGTLDAFLQEFGLSNKEGIALMCLAESLLRVPDADTADKLIAEKVSTGDWKKHLGQSSSLFVNASTWGLMLTGKIIQPNELQEDGRWYENMVSRLGEPIVRQAMLQSMKILGGQYVLGRTINEAMKRGQKENPEGTRFSFDMLGEGARTQEDAKKYFDAYMSAIHALGKANDKSNVHQSNGISIKLSALHPRYEHRQAARVKQELLPLVVELAKAANSYNIGFNIDAEEANRLDLSLELFESLARNEALSHWDGLGFVLQAYQKRAPYVARWLIQLAKETQRKFMVRLVKGAYWDTEIKHTQELGVKDYPVYTRKVNTDLSYQVCAQILFEEQDYIFPQFATHNAYSVALIMTLGKGKIFEFQRLHGMGQLLFEQVRQQSENSPPIRVYAPVGAHKDLLPYLVRRLLENGANSSFVNRFMDESTPVDELIKDVVSLASENNPYRHPQIHTPDAIFSGDKIARTNSNGIDLDDPLESHELLNKLYEFGQHHYQGGPIVLGNKIKGEQEILSPANKQLVGYSGDINDDDLYGVISAAHKHFQFWDALGGEQRAKILENVADLLQAHSSELLSLITYEAGRTLNDGISELREAVDFCRYYAQLARRHFTSSSSLTGPTGETNQLSLHGRGVFICISPWNFPLAIFAGQIAAALAAGNAVIAKPAEQTPLIASKTIGLMHEAGIPKEILHLAIGDGKTGAMLTADPRIAGIAFTGSTETAKKIQRVLAEKDGPIVPLIAETGGQNGMIVDSTALLEQVVDDVISSAFLSAGQRCSALRVLFVQKDIADNLIQMLTGACRELSLGEPWKLDKDIGPVIDEKAQRILVDHIIKMKKEAKLLFEYPQSMIPVSGTFVGPHIFEIESISQLEREVFGPILHIIRFDSKSLDDIIDSINDTGYGLTLGVHTRIENQAEKIFQKIRVGNTYVNRNMVGAVVGVNPFGGQGLSGTGPKAGGPHYLFRFATEKTFTVNTVATGGNAQLLSLEE